MKQRVRRQSSNRSINICMHLLPFSIHCHSHLQKPGCATATIADTRAYWTRLAAQLEGPVERHPLRGSLITISGGSDQIMQDG